MYVISYIVIRCTVGWFHEHKSGWIDELTEGWMDRWMEGLALCVLKDIKFDLSVTNREKRNAN